MTTHKEQKNSLDPKIEAILSTLPEKMQQETRDLIQGVQPLLRPEEWAYFQESLMNDLERQQDKLRLEKEMAEITNRLGELEQSLEALKKLKDEINKKDGD